MTKGRGKDDEERTRGNLHPMLIKHMFMFDLSTLDPISRRRATDTLIATSSAHHLV